MNAKHARFARTAGLLACAAMFGSAPVAADTTISVGGYTQAEYSMNDFSKGLLAAGGNANFTDWFMPVLIDVNGGIAQNPGTTRSGAKETNFHAKNTRLWVNSTTPMGGSDLNTHVSFDFLTLDNTAAPGMHGVNGFFTNENHDTASIARLRLAYGEWCGWTVGKNYSTFMNLNAMPELTDYGIPVGATNVFQPMVRYSRDMGPGQIQIALEDSSSNVKQFGNGEGVLLNGVVLAPDQRRKYPDIIARYNYEDHWGAVSGSLMFRNIHAGTNVDNQVRENTWEEAINVSGSIDVFSMDKFQFGVNYGTLGRYMGMGVFRDAVLDRALAAGPTLAAGTKIKRIRQRGGHIAYTHYWNDDMRSAFVYSTARASNRSEESATSADKRYNSWHVNLLWNPVKPMRLGVEYMHASRKLRNNASGNQKRLALIAKWTFV